MYWVEVHQHIVSSFHFILCEKTSSFGKFYNKYITKDDMKCKGLWPIAPSLWSSYIICFSGYPFPSLSPLCMLSCCSTLHCMLKLTKVSPCCTNMYLLICDMNRNNLNICYINMGDSWAFYNTKPNLSVASRTKDEQVC